MKQANQLLPRIQAVHCVRPASRGLIDRSSGDRLMPVQGETIIYHNPNCGTSRTVLGMLRDAGLEPRVVEYLKTPPSRAELLSLLRRMGIGPRALLRRKGTPYEALGLDNLALSDEALIDAILAHPVLMERPVVITQAGVRLCRPAETVAELIG
jgi:arsenate reductase